MVQLGISISISGAFLNDKISKSIEEGASAAVGYSSGALFEVLFVSVVALDDLFEGVVYQLVLCLCVIKLVWLSTIIKSVIPSIIVSIIWSSVSIIKAISVIIAIISRIAHKLIKLLIILLSPTLHVVSVCATAILFVPLRVVFLKSCQIEIASVTFQVVLVNHKLNFIIAQLDVEAPESFLKIPLIEQFGRIFPGGVTQKIGEVTSVLLRN